MEIKMNRSFINCRREFWWGSVRREEITECVVPDTYPDIDTIVDVSANTLIRSKEACDGKITLECAVECTVLFTAEESDELFKLNTEVPVSLSADAEGADDSTDIIASLHLEDMEVRLLNPRKILVKGEVSASIRCFEEDSLAISCSAEPENGLQLLEKTCHASPVADVKEKTFIITDEILLPHAPEGYAEILRCNTELTAQDVKFVGSKLIFKGEAKLQTLLSANGNLPPVEFSCTSSFSQMLELNTEADSARVCLCLTGQYFSLSENDMGKPVLSAELHILSQTAARVNREVTYTADAYSTAMDCSTSEEALELCLAEKENIIRETLRCEMETAKAVKELIGTAVRCTSPVISKNEAQTKLLISCMYCSESGKICRAQKSETISVSLENAEDICQLEARCADVYASASGNNIDIRVPIEINVVTRQAINNQCLKSIELTEREEKIERPSLYVVHSSDKLDLWQLAKKYSSTVDAIKEYNPEPGRVLIIPAI